VLYDLFLFSLPILEASGEIAKIGCSKKTLIFVGTNIRGYIRPLDDDYKGHASASDRFQGLTDEYMSPCVRSAPRPPA
jgi:hypothetical protein